ADPDAFGGRARGELKLAVVDAVVRGLHGVRDRYLELLTRDGGGYLDEVALQGALKARESAEKTMRVVREAVGLS
ncbi:tryptophanyl-tRNA synthetase, partial [Magnaporthiopsis poae ATCC 64411]